MTSCYPYDLMLPYFQRKRLFYYYDDCCKQAARFAPHADGVYPQELIECRRPNEPEEVKDYRWKIYVAKTEPAFSKILTSLNKIRRSPDWAIKWPDQEQFSLIATGETLEDYIDTNFPFFGSLTNWVFSVLLKPQLTDSNGVVFVRPLPPRMGEDPKLTYKRPYPEIYPSCDVIEYKEGEMAILNIPDGCWYGGGVRRPKSKGKAYYTVTTTVIERWEQVNDKEDYGLVDTYVHNLNFLPVFKMGGVICKSSETNFLYKSRISGILPEFDEALREYSDLQAGKVLHLFPERWEYTTHDCTDCKGLGKRASVDGELTCSTCKGRGVIASGPYNKMLIKLSTLDNPSTNLPTPPAGYVEKDVEIIKVMELSVKTHIYDGLAAINFQFLEQVPLAESGIAKGVDRDEANNTVHSVAEDLISLMDKIIKTSAYYRYGTLYPSPEDLKAMLPTIPVPEHYDLFSATALQTEVDTARKSKMNPVVVNAMEVEFASKRFIHDPEVANRLKLVIALDPLHNISDEDKMVRLSNRGITQLSYIISSNIQEFVQRAIDDDPDFTSLDLPDQKEIMQAYALEIQDERTAQIVSIADAPYGDVQ